MTEENMFSINCLQKEVPITKLLTRCVKDYHEYKDISELSTKDLLKDEWESTSIFDKYAISVMEENLIVVHSMKREWERFMKLLCIFWRTIEFYVM